MLSKTKRTTFTLSAGRIFTKVAADGNAEVFFENLDKRSDFNLVEEGEELETNGYKIRFTVYKKI